MEKSMERFLNGHYSPVMTTITTFWDGLEQANETPTDTNMKDVRTEIIEALWDQWINSLPDEAIDQRQNLRQMVADFASVLR